MFKKFAVLALAALFFGPAMLLLAIGKPAGKESAGAAVPVA